MQRPFRPHRIRVAPARCERRHLSNFAAADHKLRVSPRTAPDGAPTTRAVVGRWPGKREIGRTKERNFKTLRADPNLTPPPGGTQQMPDPTKRQGRAQSWGWPTLPGFVGSPAGRVNCVASTAMGAAWGGVTWLRAEPLGTLANGHSAKHPSSIAPRARDSQSPNPAMPWPRALCS